MTGNELDNGLEAVRTVQVPNSCNVQPISETVSKNSAEEGEPEQQQGNRKRTNRPEHQPGRLPAHHIYGWVIWA